jgi:RNA polymerase sigma factor (TIGR02999 family)
LTISRQPIMIAEMSRITRILSAIDRNDPDAARQLLPLVYEELRRLAAKQLANEKPGQTLQATALVHEAYLRLNGNNPDRRWDGRGHFFAVAAEAMRRILIDNARRKHGPRRGGALKRVDADLDRIALDDPGIDLLALDEALTRLAEESPARAELVKLRFFAGLTVPEAAEVLGISVATAERYWTFARTRLYADLNGPESKILRDA